MLKRYELPPPPPNKLSDTNAWYECVENVKCRGGVRKGWKSG